MSENDEIALIPRKKHKNAIYLTFKILITTIFSASIFLDSILKFVQNIRGSVNEIYFSDISISNILTFIVTWVITFLLVTIIEFIIPKIEKYIYYKEDEDKIKKKRVFFIIFSIIMLFWLPYILTYFPGGIFSDTQDSIKQCLHIKPYMNLNPLLYTLCIKVFLKIGDFFNSAQIGMNLFGVFQIITMALILSYFVYYLYKKGFSNIVLVLVTMFFCFFKLIPMYALSIWKDTPFSLALFLYIIAIVKIVYENGKNVNDNKMLIGYIILITALSFLRNNGKYVAFATTIILLIVYRKNKIFKFAVSTFITFIVVTLIQGPVFTHMGLNDSTGSYNAIMMQQIFYVKATGGNITKEQNEIINLMCEEETLNKVYSPILLDSTTTAPEFNKGYIVTNKKEIIKLWIELFMQNPTSYAKSYLLTTLGFWDVNKVFVDAYMSHFTWPGTEEIINFKQTDYIEKWTGKSIVNEIKINRLYSSAIFLFIMLFSMIFTIKKKKYKNLLIYLPALFTWGTIMVATPIAFSLRYVYILVLMIPLDFIIPFMKTKNDCRKDSKREED